MNARFDAIRQQPWSVSFSNNAIKHGLELFDAKSVHQLAINENGSGASAAVSDDKGQWRVDLAIKTDKQGHLWMNGQCECKITFNCKHVAATVIAALAVRPELETGIGLAGQAPAAPVRPPLASHLAQWLKKLETAANPGGPGPRKLAQRIIYYLRGVKSGAALRLSVSAYLVKVTKDGQLGQKRRVEWYERYVRRYQKWMEPIDARILNSVNQKWIVDYGSRIVLPEDAEASLLETLLTTGRCYWDEQPEKPLALAAARPAVPTWLADAKGLQEPAFDVSPAVTSVLALSPPWYLDLNESVAGPLETALRPRLAVAWLAGPPVSPEAAIELNRHLTEDLPTLQLPAAKALELEEIPSCEPKPCLRFFTTRMQWWEVNVGFSQAGFHGIAIHTAELSFDYAGLRVKSTDRDNGFVEQLQGGKIKRIVRNRFLELRSVERLQKLGMTSASSVLQNHDERFSNALTLADLSDNQWFKFCTETIPKLEADGWIIEYDKHFSFNVVNPTDWYGEVEPEKGNDWFGVELGVKVGEEKINLLPVLLNVLQRQGDVLSVTKLAKMPADQLVAIPLGDGRVLPFPARRLCDILSVLIELYDPKSLTAKGKLTLPRMRAAEVATLGDGQAWRWLGGDTLRELGLKLKNFRGIQRVQTPAGLQTELRPYQLEGLSWLQFLAEYKLCGVLADDMGLGKTVQALAHLLAEKEKGALDCPSLVVAPTSLMTNWRQETERFAPGLRVLVSHGLERKQHFDKLPQFDLIITSYSLLPRDADVLLGQEYHVVMLDEAQYIKNPKTKFAQIACQLKARHQLCLTGTPMENHLGELWSLFNFLMPGFLGDEQRFRTLFRNPIEKAQNLERREILARRVGPFILRRRKQDVAQELPPKTEIVQNVELSGAQRDLYESIRLAMHAKVRAEVQNKGIARSHIIILDALLKLRQVCCDPRLVPLERARQVQESAKLELLMDLVPQMITEGRRILLFSQFTSMLGLIELELEKAKIPYVLLTGETRNRATAINHFQSGQVPLFLISLKAGGTGLNLTAADTVIHYDPWWNPAVENQATDRAHRIGQEKKVFVYKLMTVGTVEEKILDLQARKRELVDGLLNEEQKEKLQLSADDLEVLFAPVE